MSNKLSQYRYYKGELTCPFDSKDGRSYWWEWEHTHFKGHYSISFERFIKVYFRDKIFEEQIGYQIFVEQRWQNYLDGIEYRSLSNNNFLNDLLFGIATGDALGVPVEFRSRIYLKTNPVTDSIGYDSHNQPPGTWSDDTSLSLCLAETLEWDCDCRFVARNFERWILEGYWTATGEVFDVGVTTRNSIFRMMNGIRPELAGGVLETENGNGSLMRILPLAFCLLDKPIAERFAKIKEISSLTHRHNHSVISCFYAVEFARGLIITGSPFAIYESLKTIISTGNRMFDIDNSDFAIFERLSKSDIWKLPESEIRSDGYVLHTLEASIWCRLTTNNYKDAVLKAVNLGEDTDTIAAVTGGLAGLTYGYMNIPESWLSKLARKNDIEALALEQFNFCKKHFQY